MGCDGIGDDKAVAWVREFGVDEVGEGVRAYVDGCGGDGDVEGCLFCDEGKEGGKTGGRAGGGDVVANIVRR